MYRFYDTISEDITNKYKISDFVIFFEEKDFENYKIALDTLCKHTCSVLEEMNELDDYGTFLIIESRRFLIHSINFQTYPNNIHKKYYDDVLNQFHKLGYLRFKQNIQSYKLYKTKKFIYKIRYHNKIIVYYSLKNMIIDFGRYKVDKITQIFPKQSCLDYNVIHNMVFLSH
ncbi:hypothetical protein CMI37_29755 [Candidatus Pacearchaeota archaeon]|nr:hypothetical protein [Candidatus Pacearchaeota archaeon]